VVDEGGGLLGFIDADAIARFVSVGRARRDRRSHHGRTAPQGG